MKIKNILAACISIASAIFADGRRVSPDLVQSIDRAGLSIGGGWLWSTDSVYDPIYRKIMTQPISVDAVSFDWLRWKASTPTITIRKTNSSTSSVLWAGTLYTIPEVAYQPYSSFLSNISSLSGIGYIYDSAGTVSLRSSAVSWDTLAAYATKSSLADTSAAIRAAIASGGIDSATASALIHDSLSRVAADSDRVLRAGDSMSGPLRVVANEDGSIRFGEYALMTSADGGYGQLGAIGRSAGLYVFPDWGPESFGPDSMSAFSIYSDKRYYFNAYSDTINMYTFAYFDTNVYVSDTVKAEGFKVFDSDSLHYLRGDGSTGLAPIPDSVRAAHIADSAKALVSYARTSAVHDTADTVRAYAMARIHDSLVGNSQGWTTIALARSAIHDTAVALRTYVGSASTSGNAATATKLATARTIATSGDATGTATAFDGSADISIPVTVTNINGTAFSGLATGILKNTTSTGVPSIAVAGTDYLAPGSITSGTYRNVTVAASGLVTGGTNPTTLGPGYGVVYSDTVLANHYAPTAGSSSITTLGTVTTGTWHATAIGAVYGGTGKTSYTIGDLLYASSTTALSKLVDVATGSALISGGVGVAPSWGKIALASAVSGTLLVANGGTGLASWTAYAVPYASATTTIAGLEPNTTTSIKALTMTGTGSAGAAPAWASVVTSLTGDGIVVPTTTATTGAVALAHAAFGTAGTYGSVSTVPVLTTNATGHVTSVTATSISITHSQVSDWATAGVSSITGTANQVIASASVGAVTLSLPQSIATTSSPTFAGQKLTGALSGTSATFGVAAMATWTGGSSFAWFGHDSQNTQAKGNSGFLQYSDGNIYMCTPSGKAASIQYNGAGYVVVSSSGVALNAALSGTSATFSGTLGVTGTATIGSTTPIIIGASAQTGWTTTPGFVGSINGTTSAASVGIQISTGMIEYDADSSASHSFYVGGTNRLDITASGMVVTGTLTANYGMPQINYSGLAGTLTASGSITGPGLWLINSSAAVSVKLPSPASFTNDRITVLLRNVIGSHGVTFTADSNCILYPYDYSAVSSTMAISYSSGRAFEFFSDGTYWYMLGIAQG